MKKHLKRLEGKQAIEHEDKEKKRAKETFCALLT